METREDGVQDSSQHGIATNGDRDDFRRARDLVMSYGWNSTCFQIVNPGIEYWFGSDGESVVGYVSSGNVRVVAGSPVCPLKDLKNITAEFESNSADDHKSVCYFGAEGRLESLASRHDRSFVCAAWRSAGLASRRMGRRRFAPFVIAGTDKPGEK